MEPGETQTNPGLPPRGMASGTRVVVGLFVFGILMTGGLWLYWLLHLAPFFPLQKSLADTFPKSSPRVEGGRHRDSPPTLRIVLQIPFTPVRGNEQTESVIDRTVKLARGYQEIGKYEILEIYLVHPVPEKAAERLKIELPLGIAPAR